MIAKCLACSLWRPNCKLRFIMSWGLASWQSAKSWRRLRNLRKNIGFRTCWMNLQGYELLSLVIRTLWIYLSPADSLMRWKWQHLPEIAHKSLVHLEVCSLPSIVHGIAQVFIGRWVRQLKGIAQLETHQRTCVSVTALYLSDLQTIVVGA